MRFDSLAEILALALILPGVVLAADCTAEARVAIGADLTPQWRQFVVDVSSAGCLKASCSGMVDVKILPRSEKLTESETFHVSLPYTIQKSHASEHFKITRRSMSSEEYQKTDKIVVEGVSCANP